MGDIISEWWATSSRNDRAASPGIGTLLKASPNSASTFLIIAFTAIMRADQGDSLHLISALIPVLSNAEPPPRRGPEGGVPSEPRVLSQPKRPRFLAYLILIPAQEARRGRERFAVIEGLGPFPTKPRLSLRPWTPPEDRTRRASANATVGRPTKKLRRN